MLSSIKLQLENELQRTRFEFEQYKNGEGIRLDDLNREIIMQQYSKEQCSRDLLEYR
jgi:hypothetical protein